MGFFDELSSLLGGGPNNQSFQAVAPISTDQANQAYQNTQTGLTQQQALINALQAQNGLGNQASVFNQLQGVVNGTGPNPAQAMLNQATGENVANQAALMAGQRGAAMNPGLIARLAAQQGANTQQQAIGQGATLQANQALNALGQMGSLANQQAGQYTNAIGNYNNAAQGQQGQLLGAIANQNAINQGMAATNANNAAKFTSGVVGGLFNNGISKLVGGGGGGGSPMDTTPLLGGGGAAGSGLAGGAMDAGTAAPLVLAASSGGKITEKGVQPPRSFSSPIPPHLSHLAAIYHPTLAMKSGGAVPGKALIKGDNPKNDTVPAMLSPGEVVIPKSVMESDDPAGNAAKFVAALAKKQSKEPQGEFKEALKRAIAGRKSK